MLNDIQKVCIYIIQYELDHERSISKLRLQKLLYFIQRYFLACEDRLCFEDTFVAWEMGPTHLETYARYNFFGSLSIVIDKRFPFDELIPSERDRELINHLLNRAECFSTTELIEKAKDDKAYQLAFAKGYGTEIPNEIMREAVHCTERT